MFISHISRQEWTKRHICTLTVSLPIPAFPPVTIITFPERSGMSATPHLALGGDRIFEQARTYSMESEDTNTGNTGDGSRPSYDGSVSTVRGDGGEKEVP